VILEEGAPCLRRWPSAAAHVLADAEAMTFLCHCARASRLTGPSTRATSSAWCATQKQKGIARWTASRSPRPSTFARSDVGS
jgi:hypothetical protein